MRRMLLLPALCLFLAAVLVPASTANAAAGDAAAVLPGGGRVIIDVGWIAPLGDLGDRLDATPTGAGARPGFEIGLEWRFALSRTWSLAPTGHYLGYGDATGLGTSGEESLSPSSLRYGAELMISSDRAGTQWFAGVGPAYVRSVLKGPGKDHITLVDASKSGWGLSARAGLRFGDTELSAVYHLNRFRSFGFFAAAEEQSYDWGTVALRLGWRLP
ncbi:MAG: outer membrane beta-barrel protein [bacterium]|nr:outer membrane beta-barrel protein [bacterium]